jgi:hypothetical protein
MRSEPLSVSPHHGTYRSTWARNHGRTSRTDGRDWADGCSDTDGCDWTERHTRIYGQNGEDRSDGSNRTNWTHRPDRWSNGSYRSNWICQSVRTNRTVRTEFNGSNGSGWTNGASHTQWGDRVARANRSDRDHGRNRIGWRTWSCWS